jgi:hypothetical protein
MNNGPAPDELRRELAAARAALARDAHAAAADARTLADWRHHFRAHPWLCCAGAMAIGYWVVPARASRATAATGPPEQAVAPAAAKSLATTLLGLGATFLARQSLDYMMRHGLDWFDRHAASRSGRPNGEAKRPQGASRDPSI